MPETLRRTGRRFPEPRPRCTVRPADTPARHPPPPHPQTAACGPSRRATVDGGTPPRPRRLLSPTRPARPDPRRRRLVRGRDRPAPTNTGAPPRSPDSDGDPTATPPSSRARRPRPSAHPPDPAGGTPESATPARADRARRRQPNDPRTPTRGNPARKAAPSTLSTLRPSRLGEPAHARSPTADRSPGTKVQQNSTIVDNNASGSSAAAESMQMVPVR